MHNFNNDDGDSTLFSTTNNNGMKKMAKYRIGDVFPISSKPVADRNNDDQNPELVAVTQEEGE